MLSSRQTLEQITHVDGTTKLANKNLSQIPMRPRGTAAKFGLQSGRQYAQQGRHTTGGRAIFLGTALSPALWLQVRNGLEGTATAVEDGK